MKTKNCADSKHLAPKRFIWQWHDHRLLMSCHVLVRESLGESCGDVLYRAPNIQGWMYNCQNINVIVISVKWYKMEHVYSSGIMKRNNISISYPTLKSKTKFSTEMLHLMKLYYCMGFWLVWFWQWELTRCSKEEDLPYVTQAIPKERWGQYLERGLGDSAPVGTASQMQSQLMSAVSLTGWCWAASGCVRALNWAVYPSWLLLT